MQILGQLGIDPTLLLAQIANFLILLVLLKKYLYKPIVDQIHADEKKFKQAKEEKEAVAKDKEQFDSQSQTRENKIKEQSRTIISEAESISNKIMKEKIKKIEADMKLLSKEKQKEFDDKLASQTDAFKTSFSQAVSKKLADLFSGGDYQTLLAQLNQNYLNGLVDQLKSVGLDKEPLDGVRLELDSVIENQDAVNRVKGEIKNITGKDIEIDLKIEPDLIVGFRLKLPNQLVDASLLGEIQDANN